MKQEDIFKDSEGTAWLDRNKNRLSVTADPILDFLRLYTVDLNGKSVLEIGAADGWRLNTIKTEFGAAQAYGCDPSARGGPPSPAQPVAYGTAAKPCGNSDVHESMDGFYDLIIYGFCLYLCDREDLFKIAYWGDRLLAKDGQILIWDFYPDRNYSKVYHHDKRLRSYKMQYASLWMWNPLYRIVHQRTYGSTKNHDERMAVILLQKRSAEEAWPLRP